MQQMAGHMNLLNPFVFNQFGAYGAYAQVKMRFKRCISNFNWFFIKFSIFSSRSFFSFSQQQQAALMAAATAQGTYINPMAALATQIPHALNGEHLFLLSLVICN